MSIPNENPKDHHLDAYCIACSVITSEKPRLYDDKPYGLMQFRRHDRQGCHQQMLDRKYKLDGKVVATNRHKAMEQKGDSLEECRAKLLEDNTPEEVQRIVSKLTVVEHSARYKDMARPMPGGIMVCNGKTTMMHHSKGRHNGVPDYYIDTQGNRYNAKKCKFEQNNNGIRFVGKM